jgi:hypothetical protein
MPTGPGVPSTAPLAPQTAGHGLELSPAEWADQIFTPLQNASAIMSLPGVQLHDSYGPLTLPRMSAAPLDDTAWVAPDAAVPEVNLSTGGAVLLPRSVKALKCIPRISAETIRSSVDGPLNAAHDVIIIEMVKRIDPALISGNVASGIAGLISQSVALNARTVADAVLNSTTTVTSATAAFTAADVAATVTGTGIPAGASIASVTNATTVVLSAAATATATGVTITITDTGASFDLLQDALTTALDHWARPDSWLINTRTLGALHKVKDSLGRPLLQPNMQQRSAAAEDGAVVHDILYGLPVYAAPSVPLGAALLIDEDQVHIGRDRDAEMRVLDQLYAGYDEYGFLIVSRWDVGLISSYGVVVVTGLGPAS